MFARILNGFWLVLKCVWSDSPMILKASLMDSQLRSFVRFFWSDSSLILICFGRVLHWFWTGFGWIPHWLWTVWGWIASWFCKANYMKHTRRMLYKSIRIDPYWILFEFQLEAEINDIWMSTQRGLNDNSIMIQSTFASIRIQWTLHENAGGTLS